MKKNIATIIVAVLFGASAYAQLAPPIQYQNTCGIISGGGCSNPTSKCTGINGAIANYWAWKAGYAWVNTINVSGSCTDDASAYSDYIGGCICS
jgi:hypothetical protein